jgi:hypothetical protein
VLNAAAFDYMRERALSATLIARLAEQPETTFADQAAWSAQLDRLGFTGLTITPDPVQIATEGAIWGSTQAHGFACDAVVLSDDAGQFDIGRHALCRVGGDVAAPTPHRPGRADFPHPVLHERASPAAAYGW